MAQRVKFDDLSLVPRTHKLEGGNQLLQVVLCVQRTWTHTDTHTETLTHNINREGRKLPEINMVAFTSSSFWRIPDIST